MKPFGRPYARDLIGNAWLDVNTDQELREEKERMKTPQIAISATELWKRRASDQAAARRAANKARRQAAAVRACARCGNVKGPFDCKTILASTKGAPLHCMFCETEIRRETRRP